MRMFIRRYRLPHLNSGDSCNMRDGCLSDSGNPLDHGESTTRRSKFALLEGGLRVLAPGGGKPRRNLLTARCTGDPRRLAAKFQSSRPSDAGGPNGQSGKLEDWGGSLIGTQTPRVRRDILQQPLEAAEPCIPMGNKLYPFPRILNTPQPLIRNIPYKTTYILRTILNIRGLGV